MDLGDYPDLLDDLGPHAGEVLRASWTEASRVLSRAGLANYLRGAQALHTLGRGSEPVANFIQEAPAVAREVGEDVLADLVQSALAMASKTSGAVIALMLATAPVAARRLGDAELFRAYLSFLGQLLAQAPRGMRPMLEQIEPLLGQLTLGGLRRWALWGAQAHRVDFAAQERYFSLTSPDSQSVLQQERKGTLFVDVQRRIGMYLRALWGRDIFMRPTSTDYEARDGGRPFIEKWTVHLADAYDDWRGISGLELYRAAAAHAAAHLAYTRQTLSAEALNPLQMALIAVIEDARVEQLAIRAFPGLGPLWRKLHVATPDCSASIGDWLDRIARALLDSEYVDAAPLIAKARLLFAGRSDGLDNNALSWDIGVALAHDLSRLGLAYHPRRDVLAAPYRDDNRFIWEFAEVADFGAAVPWQEQQVVKHVDLMEFINEVDVETAGDDAQEIWILGTELYDDDGTTWNAREGREPAPEPHHYPEWDYQIQLERPNWCTLLEKRVAPADPAEIEAIVARHKPLVSRLKFLIEALQPQGMQRLRKQEDGDEIDLNAAVRAMIDLKSGQMPDPRINIRHVRKVRDIAVLLLIDLSESTNDAVAGSDRTVLQLAREATALLADAMSRIGDPFALHGFASDGRHEIEYFRFKDFDEDYGELPRGRLAAMESGKSTRMGTAIRHATRLLRRCPQQKKLLLVLTDGEPADIDVRDPQYLRLDAKKAIEDASRSGVSTFCLNLDPQADQYVSRIFGANRYLVLDHVERLPERLPLLYMGLTR
ncbi:MAG: VWA domain-containing protein [Rhodocyclaceae bacterium]|nr:VWA domain-containing protein [Rhodocyclaceae bacterium]